MAADNELKCLLPLLPLMERFVGEVDNIYYFGYIMSIKSIDEQTLLLRVEAKRTEALYYALRIWKTNKEATGRYPAYIFYHTDYSSARKELIKRDMAFSSDEQQIRDILVAEIADNIKKDWEEVL